MDLKIKKIGEIIVVIIKGNIGFEDINEFSSTLVPIIENTFRPKFVFDMGDMPYINSATIGKFIGIFKKINEVGGAITFCNVRPFVRNILDITKLSTVFDIYDSQEEALEAVKNKIKSG